ncbi:DUF1150 family protein [Rhodobacterales bacterium HKCCE3408]|nr:DUF1150 family protein [Rhodobacterales bacterium HKCCE3408]
MNTPHDAANSPRPIVYIRKVAVADLPEEIRAQAGAVDSVYAIGREDGTPVALVRDRNMAFVLARQNEMTPVSVH